MLIKKENLNLSQEKSDLIIKAIIATIAEKTEFQQEERRMN